LIRSFSYQVITRATPKLAWEVFSNWRRWQTFSSAYGSLEWVQGEPWAVGSRLRIEILRPIYADVDHVITACEPGRSVAWIDNVLGAVLEQWVAFEELPSGGTSVTVSVNIAGGDLVKVGDQDPEKLVREFTEEWYENFRVVCDELSPAPGKE
jgi:Polyketide cyclase / dehydrase and lipid transport